MEFSGALVLVTHDRYLLDRVSQKILALDGRGHANFYADLSQWEDLRPTANIAPVAAVRPTPPPTVVKSGLSAQELKDLRKLEKQLLEAEEKRKEARLAMEDPAVSTDAQELIKRQERLDGLDRETEILFQRWSELEARNTIT